MKNPALPNAWKDVLLDLKRRGLKHDPQLAIDDGALGFWKALPQVFGATREQRCWVHKTANVLNKLPKHLQPKAKSDLHQIWMAATRDDAHRAFATFVQTYEPKYPKTAECLAKDQDALLAFYDFPAAHWIHLRTTNPIESTFATVRLRTRSSLGPSHSGQQAHHHRGVARTDEVGPGHSKRLLAQAVNPGFDQGAQNLAVRVLGNRDHRKVWFFSSNGLL